PGILKRTSLISFKLGICSNIVLSLSVTKHRILCNMDTPYSKKNLCPNVSDTWTHRHSCRHSIDHNLFDIAFRKFSILIHVIHPY
ncbi:hypothetical protein GIB67_039501, partial [Kingdonia uniflora]